MKHANQITKIVQFLNSLFRLLAHQHSEAVSLNHGHAPDEPKKVQANEKFQNSVSV